MSILCINDETANRHIAGSARGLSPVLSQLPWRVCIKDARAKGARKILFALL